MILKNVFKISKGKKAVESNDNNLQRYIQIGDLRSDDKIKYAEHDDKNIICNENDVLIAWDGANAGTIGYNLKGVIGSTLAKLSPKVDNIYSPYTGRFLQSQFRYLRETCTGATIPHISRPTLESLKIPLPPLDQQKKIAAILDSADAYRQKTKALIEKYDELTQSLFLNMFGDPVRNPKGWKEKPMGELADLKMGGTPSTKHPEYYENGTVNWMKSGDIKGDFITNFPNKITQLGLENSNTKLYNENTVVIALNGQGKTRGTTGLITESTCSNQSVANIDPGNNMNSAFLHFQLKSRYKHLRNLTGDNDRSGLNLTILRNYKIFNPKMEFQNQFAERVQAIEAQKAQTQASLAQAEDLFDSLLQRAFKGELV